MFGPGFWMERFVEAVVMSQNPSQKSLAQIVSLKKKKKKKIGKGSKFMVFQIYQANKQFCVMIFNG